MDKQFDFLIENEFDDVVKFNFFKIEKGIEAYSIYVYGIEEDISSFLKKGSEIYLTYRGASVCVDFVVLGYNSIETDGLLYSVIINTSLNSYLDVFIDNFYAKIFYSLRECEKKYQWYNLNRDERRLWLNACSSIDNTGKKNFVSDIIHIDFSELENMLDFYCFFGDQCLGYTGYMGANLDALDDMLCDIHQESIENTIFVFYNFDLFRDRIESDEVFEVNRLDKLLNIFDLRGLRYRFGKLSKGF